MDPLGEMFGLKMEIPDVIEDFSRNDPGVASSLKNGLDYHQKKILNNWLYTNCIKRVKVEYDRYRKRVKGLSVYHGEELSSVSIEFILWDRLKEAYKKDFAEFVKSKMSKDGDVKEGEDKE